MNLERDLERVLQRRSPAPGFAGRVLQRIDEQESRKRPVWWRTAAASLTLAALLGGYATHKVIERREGLRAKEQVLLAMRITSEKVSMARHEVREIGSHH
jgi:hypothetical protein